jgi:hypothetical protein
VPLFRRRSSGDSSSDHASFWDWWTAEGRALAEQTVTGGLDPHSFAETMTSRLDALGGLSWEIAPGEVSEHVLVVGAEGDAELRALARRVVLAAPEPDETWAYVDSRPPSPDPESVVVGIEGQDVDLARVKVAARMNDGLFDVQVHHPSFTTLPEQARAMATFLAVDAALGEVDTELWLGEVLPVEHEPLDGFGLVALRSVVQDLKRQRLDADGQPRWVMLRGETADGLLLAMVRSPLHPITAPHLDTYVAVTVPYRAQAAGGQPGDGSLEALRAFEHRLGARLGNDGQVVAHLSAEGVRTFHLYVDSTTGALTTVKDVARAWSEGSTSVHDMHDPAWQAVAHLRQ